MSDAGPVRHPSLPMQLQLFGEYAIDAEIEQGPTWSIYRAYHVSRPEDRFLARVLRGADATQRNVVEAFARGAYILEQLKHPRIVPVVAAGVDQGVVFIIKPEIEGVTLAKRMAQGEPLDPADVVRIVRETAEVLEFCHRHEPPVPHYALEPSKILLTKPRGDVMVLEVGYVHALEEVARVEPMDDIPKPGDAYRAPEMSSGAAMTCAVDQYALARIAAEMLAHCGAASEPLKAAAEPVLSRGAAADSAARFPSVSEFAQAFQDAITPATRPTAAKAGTAGSSLPRPGPVPRPSGGSMQAVKPPAGAKAPAVAPAARPGPPAPSTGVTRSKATIVGAPPMPAVAPKPAVAPAPAEPSRPAEAAPPATGSTAKFSPLGPGASVASQEPSAPMARHSVPPAAIVPPDAHDAVTVEAPAASPTLAAARALSKLPVPGAKNRPATIPGLHGGPPPDAGAHDAPTVESVAAPSFVEAPSQAVTREIALPEAEQLRASAAELDLVDAEFAESLPPIVPSLPASEPTTPDAVPAGVSGVAAEHEGEPLFGAPSRSAAVSSAARMPASPPPLTEEPAEEPPPPPRAAPPAFGEPASPPRMAAHARPSLESDRPPPTARSSGGVRAATILGVCIVLASLIYTGGFMLREPLMRLALGRGGGTPPGPTADHRTGATVASNGTAGNAVMVAPPTSTADAAAAGAHAPVVDAAVVAAHVTVDASVAAADAGSVAAQHSADAGAGPNVAVGTVDAGVVPAVVAPPPSTGPLPRHPNYRDRYALEQQIADRVNGCDGHVGHHARIHVAYAGATGEVSEVQFSGNTFVGLPITPCIEQAVRAFAMPRFTDSIWRTEYTIFVH